MKSLLATLLLLISLATTARSLEILDYNDVKSVTCSNETANITIDIEKSEIEGELNQLGITKLTNKVDEDLGLIIEVGIMEDFLGSGFDLMAGIAVSDDFASFGTYGIVLDSPLFSLKKDMTVIYVEAMTGRQVEMKMICTFKM